MTRLALALALLPLAACNVVGLPANTSTPAGDTVTINGVTYNKLPPAGAVPVSGAPAGTVAGPAPSIMTGDPTLTPPPPGSGTGTPSVGLSVPPPPVRDPSTGTPPPPPPGPPSGTTGGDATTPQSVGPVDDKSGGSQHGG